MKIDGTWEFVDNFSDWLGRVEVPNTEVKFFFKDAFEPGVGPWLDGRVKEDTHGSEFFKRLNDSASPASSSTLTAHVSDEDKKVLKFAIKVNQMKNARVHTPTPGSILRKPPARRRRGPAPAANTSNAAPQAAASEMEMEEVVEDSPNSDI